MSLLAAIDVGSNTLRLLIAGIEKDRLIHVFSDRRITRLGNGVAETGGLQDRNMEVSISALREFSSLISEYGIRRVRAVATSALREASNSANFIKRVLESTGIKIEVISGEKEAELTLKGILANFPRGSFLPSHPGFIVDIGGGSTEWIFCRGEGDVNMGSIPIGVIKLAENFIKSDPVSEADLNRLNRAIVPSIEDLWNRIGRLLTENTIFVGTAGTFTTIASIDLGLNSYIREKIHLRKISLSRLHTLAATLTALTLAERKKIRGLEPERADLIIPGIQFTIKIMEFFEFDELIISDYGLLEGALLDIEKDISKAGKS